MRQQARLRIVVLAALLLGPPLLALVVFGSLTIGQCFFLGAIFLCGEWFALLLSPAGEARWAAWFARRQRPSRSPSPRS